MNGGGVWTVNYQKSGYLSVQRQAEVAWQDYAVLPEVVLIPYDSLVTAIDLSQARPMQVARGSLVTDGEGTRQATLLFPQGTQAQMRFPDGSTQPINTLNVWATEYSDRVVGRKAANTLQIALSGPHGGNTIPFQYDLDGLLTQAGSMTLSRNAQNGLITGTTVGSVSTSQSYSSFGELSSYRAACNSTNLYNVVYSRDQLGRITDKTETIDAQTDTYSYEYDTAGRLAEVRKNGHVISPYTYDGNGNRLSYTGVGTFHGSYDDQDRLTQYGITTYTYTANGELLTKTTGGQTTTYNYDVLGNLVSVTLPGGSQIEYLIDGNNRRVGKKVNGVLVQGFL